MLSDEKKTLEIGVWLNKINKFTVDLREQEHKIDAANASYEVCEKDLLDLESRLESIANEIAGINLAIEQSRLGASGFEEEALRKDGEASVLNATVEHNNETVARLTADINDADDSGKSIDEQIKQKQAIIDENEQKSAEKKAMLEAVAGELSKVQDENLEISDKTLELNKKLTSLTLQLSDAKVKASQVSSSIEEINSRKDTLSAQIDSVEKDIEYTKSQKDESEKNLEFIRERISEYENSLGGYRIKLQGKTEAAEKIRDKVNSLSRKYGEKTDRANVLLDLEKNMEGFSGAVKAVLKQSQNKALSGIHGTLSQLITVDNEYSTAIEIALGAAMQNIVVSSESDAKRAIAYLKQNNVGRATFLPISAIKPRIMQEKNLDDNFGFVDVASNLVECDGQYRDIIENLLGRVMIVEDIDCAVGISKRYENKYKTVTLDGQVINPGGSMTGGSKGRGSGVLSRANLIEQFKDEAREIKNELDSAQLELKKAVEAANLAGADLQGADADLRNAKEELIRAEGTINLSETNFRPLRRKRRLCFVNRKTARAESFSLRRRAKRLRRTASESKRRARRPKTNLTRFPRVQANLLKSVTIFVREQKALTLNLLP